MGDIINSNKALTKKLADDALKAKHSNKTLIMEVQEHRRTTLDLKIRFTTLKAITSGPEQEIKGYKEQK